MKEKESIKLKINSSLNRICNKYGVTPEQLFLQFQDDITNSNNENSCYPEILADLYLAEFIADRSKVERSSIESVLAYMKSNSNTSKRIQKLPTHLSATTKRILKECKYQKRHTKN